MSEPHTPCIIYKLFIVIFVGGSDYQEIDTATLEVNLLSNKTHVQSFSVNITNDPFFEDSENFTLELRFEPGTEPPSNVSLYPIATVVNIIDDDGAIILCYNDVTSCFVNVITCRDCDWFSGHFVHCGRERWTSECPNWSDSRIITETSGC